MCVSPVSAQSFQLREITLGEFEWIIFSIRSSSACGSDNVCVRMLKLGFPAIGGVILHTINTCLIQSDIPDSWKHSIVHPLFKTGKPSDPANFRPISQVPVIMKVVEHTVHHKLYIYLPHNHLLAPSQHGFRPRHSTETVLLSKSKCFDVIDHDLLIRNLVLHGIEIPWFAAYLHGHTQSVFLERCIRT